MIKTSIVWLAVAVMSGAACGSKKQGAVEDKHAETAAGSAATPAKLSPKDVFGAKIALPAIAGKLRLGMTRAEATAAEPEILAAKYGFHVPSNHDIQVSVYFSDKSDRIRTIQIKLPMAVDAVKAMLASWGEPRTIKISTGEPNYYWHDLEAGIRVKGEPIATDSQLIFEPALSLDKYLGSDPKHFGWELKPLLGMAKDDVMATFAAWTVMPGGSPDTIQFSPPSSEVAEFSGSIVATLKADKVVGYDLDLDWGWDPSVKAKVLARLEQLFGKSKKADVELYVDYPGPPKVKAEHGETHTHLWVGNTGNK